MPTPDGRCLGSSSQALRKGILAWPRLSPRPRTPAFPAWWRRVYYGPARAKSACSGLMSCPKTGVPNSDTRLIVWEAVHHLVRVHDKEGEDAAASLMSKLGPNAEAARELAYRLYRICDRKNRSQEAIGYNALVQSWPEVARLAQQVVGPTQGRMGLPGDS